MPIGDSETLTSVPLSNVILPCLEFIALCNIVILDTTRLPSGNETEPFKTKSDILQDDEWIVVLCEVDIFKKDPSPTFIKSTAAR